MTKSQLESIINKYGKDAFYGFTLTSGEKVYIYGGMKYDLESEGFTVYRNAQLPSGPQIPAIMVYSYDDIISVSIDYARSTVKKYDETAFAE